MSAAEQLIVFVKAPIRGTVKTRIASTLGDGPALEIYLSLVQTVLGQISSLPAVALCHTPDGAGDQIRPWLRAGWLVMPQGAGDLGERMHRAFGSAFAAGSQRVVLVGSDSPGVNDQDIRDAWQALRDHDVVLGPAVDGGYWLIGLRKSQACLFESMRWSTNNVLAETVMRVRANGLTIRMLRQLSDIDTAEDWQNYQARQLTPAPTAP